MTVREFLEMNIDGDTSYDLVEIWDCNKQTTLTDGTIDCIIADGCEFLDLPIEDWNLTNYKSEPMLCLNIDTSNL